MEEGVDGLLRDKTRPPGKTPLAPEPVAKIVGLTHTSPPHAATHWTLRAMAKAVGVAASSVWAVWHAHGLMPHRWRPFTLSNDPACLETLTDIVGLSVAPPAYAVVLSTDDRSHSQARDRTQPGLPLKKGRGATMTHDSKRNGTTMLFAALTVLDGTVIGQHASRHRHQEFLRCRNRIARTIPAGVPVHAILDNDTTHKHKEVQVWLARHPRWTFHVTPTSSAWLNALEGVFAKRHDAVSKTASCRSVRELQDAIRRVIDEHNTTEARPFVWIADPGTIIAARIKRGPNIGINSPGAVGYRDNAVRLQDLRSTLVAEIRDGILSELWR